MRRKVKGIVGCVAAVVIICQGIWCPEEVFAEEFSGQKNSLDITFVVDASGSMRTNDPNGIALEMVKAFVDTVHTEEISVGFVAYSDTLVSSSAPVSMSAQSDREQLKSQIGATVYSGNTDIGLGLAEAYDQMPAAEGKERIIVLISDGETDLRGSLTGRTEQQSNQDVERIVQNCRDEGVPVYTIAFGQYSGSTAVLETIAQQTGANTYTAQSPDLLIEVLYGILNNNLAYKIRQISAGTYAQGSQEINGVLNEAYLNEVDVLLISPQKVGDAALLYGDTQIPMTAVSYYAVGKISGDDIDDEIRDLTIRTETADGQQVKVYVIGYRNLTPVLDLETDAGKNEDISYRVYFRDKTGNEIHDEAFYRGFDWEMYDGNASTLITESQVTAEGIRGVLRYGTSGNYDVRGSLSDKLGEYQFIAGLYVRNTPPNFIRAVSETHSAPIFCPFFTVSFSSLPPIFLHIFPKNA
ncbi:MAG: vWA domain-containing protein [Lachnospiraceae bacterium]